jgi:Uma2 family endonuclease
MSSVALKRYTVAEYLAMERASETKHEYFDGEIFAMAGASEPHNLIAWNIGGELHHRLKNGSCRAYVSDMRVRCPSGLRTYPDVSVVCGGPQFEDDRRDTLLNPLAIFEVLSPSTEKYDRGNKFENYQAIPSLREYVLIHQDRMRVEHFSRREGGDEWVLRVITDPASAVRFQSLDCEVPLSELYAKVEFPPGKLALHNDVEDSGE